MRAVQSSPVPPRVAWGLTKSLHTGEALGGGKVGVIHMDQKEEAAAGSLSADAVREMIGAALLAERTERERQLWEQEHRLLPALRNLFDAWLVRRSDGGAARSASLISLAGIVLRSTRTVTFLGAPVLIATIIAVQANRLLFDQNARLDAQTYVMEAQARVQITTEMASLLASVAAKREKRMEAVGSEEVRFTLDQADAARIVGLMRILRPYRRIDDDLPDPEAPEDKRGFGGGLDAAFFWLDGMIFGRPVVRQRAPDQPEIQWRPRSPERGYVLQTLHALGVDLRGLINMGMTLEYADLVGSRLRDANLAGANLVRADLSGADLSFAVLDDASLYGADLINAALIEARLASTVMPLVVMNGANLGGAHLDGAFLFRGRFLSAFLRKASLREADLGHADMTQAYLVGADFRGANLYLASLRYAEVGGADFREAKGLTQEQISQTCVAAGEEAPRLPPGLLPPTKVCPTAQSIYQHQIQRYQRTIGQRPDNGSERPH